MCLEKDQYQKGKIIPDPIYNSKVVTRFINKIMLKGKKSTAEKIFYGALDIIGEKTKKNPLEVFEQAMENVIPVLEVRARRVGGQPIRCLRKSGREKIESCHEMACRLFQAETGKTMTQKLSDELMDAAKGVGSSVKKKEDTYKMAEANKAFAHYRW